MKRFKIVIPDSRDIIVTCERVKLAQNGHGLECYDDAGDVVAYFHQFTSWMLQAPEGALGSPISSTTSLPTRS